MNLNYNLKKWFMGVAVTVLLAVGTIGCAGGEIAKPVEAGDTKNASGVNQPTATAAPTLESTQPVAETTKPADHKTVYPLTVKDASGLEIIFTKAPERILSLSPSETEVLFALGLDSSIVGVTQWCDYPEAANSKPKIGTMQGDPEAILAANPDFVIGGLTLNKKTVDALRELKLTVFTVEPENLDGIMDRILLIGVITDKQAEAETLIDDMKKSRQNIATALKGLTDKKKVYIEFSPGWTVGSGEYLNEIIEEAGGMNIAALSGIKGWSMINEEQIVKDNPQVILFSNGIEKLEETIKARSGWDQIAAIKDKQLFGLDDNIISRPGPRAVQALEFIAKAVYPELVK